MMLTNAVTPYPSSFWRKNRLIARNIPLSSSILTRRQHGEVVSEDTRPTLQR